MKIDPSKKYRYRNGEPARVLCVDAPCDNYPVISMLPNGDTLRHCESGAYYLEGSSSRDLIEVREPREWLAIVATEGNAKYPAGTPIDFVNQREHGRPNTGDKWEYVRVREIIEP